ncbi:MAG: hypothetical protein COT91_02170 [Candidatus Doudnabacteria bacterium CG10_big_fil_rev_8_21_14_0_10_41_10]|uniref:Uncharacterized protein n=1 Tax=Candidatus Doudnabacteria bacterium CG10_big_fil_rev_8_21_14_0_10_41_10 TaxID=1974551 RepID=A0A2H0VDZ5_9BACT|nr:MAG: hypothetical protein COT91_02170 [Candidatus Doudnabacteria bacterium CG10_big_fil_rev_8_21_14_0_10_41_10]
MPLIRVGQDVVLDSEYKTIPPNSRGKIVQIGTCSLLVHFSSVDAGRVAEFNLSNAAGLLTAEFTVSP